MPNVNTTLTTFAIAGVMAVGSLAAGTWSSDVNSGSSGSGISISAAHADSTETAPRWAASATGRIEPVSGQIRLASETAGQIKHVLAKTNDKAMDGDLLVVLDDSDYTERIAAAAAEVDVREREREEESVEGLAKDRQNAGDDVAKAERKVFAAWRTFDAASIALRNDNGLAAAVTSARAAIEDAEAKLEDARGSLNVVNAKADMPLLTRLESSLAIARTDLALAERAFERTRVRAPFEGTVLNVFANVGDAAAPAAQPLLVFGDISKLRVRAEVEERDVARIRVGQKIIVRADAFPDREFTGTVTEIASALGAPRIATRGPRRPNDVDVLEVVAEIDGTPALLSGMRVDVFFKRIAGDAKK